jgi:hypothetical protein
LVVLQTCGITNFLKVIARYLDKKSPGKPGLELCELSKKPYSEDFFAAFFAAFLGAAAAFFAAAFLGAGAFFAGAFLAAAFLSGGVAFFEAAAFLGAAAFLAAAFLGAAFFAVAMFQNLMVSKYH